MSNALFMVFLTTCYLITPVNLFKEYKSCHLVSEGNITQTYSAISSVDEGRCETVAASYNYRYGRSAAFHVLYKSL